MGLADVIPTWEALGRGRGRASHTPPEEPVAAVLSRDAGIRRSEAVLRRASSQHSRATAARARSDDSPYAAGPLPVDARKRHLCRPRRTECSTAAPVTPSGITWRSPEPVAR